MKKNSLFSKVQIYPLNNSQGNWVEKFALKSSRTIGKCPVCGKMTVFNNFTENLRESGQCRICHSTNRQRQMAFTLLEAIYEMTEVKFKSIKDFTSTALNHRKFINFQLYNTETTGCVNHLLKDYKNYVASEYMGDTYLSGEIINGILHQNLKQTSFANSSIDIVLSSDVFEHMPNPYQAFAEIYRILKPGGRHIFTVPFYSDRYCDEIRANLNEDGTIKYLLPPIYHGDPIRAEGILVYVIFSMEMLVKLSDMGYNVRMYNVRNPIQGILGRNALVFDTIKIG